MSTSLSYTALITHSLSLIQPTQHKVNTHISHVLVHLPHVAHGAASVKQTH